MNKGYHFDKLSAFKMLFFFRLKHYLINISNFIIFEKNHKTLSRYLSHQNEAGYRSNHVYRQCYTPSKVYLEDYLALKVSVCIDSATLTDGFQQKHS